jgi:hypothetical protein
MTGELKTRQAIYKKPELLPERSSELKLIVSLMIISWGPAGCTQLAHLQVQT